MRAARIDANHTEIVKALRQCGCSVQSLASVGKGCPDLLVGWKGHNHLLEVKDGAKPKSQRKLTDHEFMWHLKWRGKAEIVNSVKEALALIVEK